MGTLLALAAVLRPHAGLPHVLPAVLALGTVGVIAAGLPRTRRFVAVASGTVSLVSLAATTVWFSGPARTGGGPWPLLHTLAMMILVALACRWAPVAQAVAAGVLAVLALAFLGIPITGLAAASGWEFAAICAFWSLAAFVGAGAGGYLRWLDAQRVRSVRHARRAQRLRLATDLHDFVAHDVSAMVIQAQAAQVLLRTDPEEAARMLQRIEADGTHALASMDGTIRVLRELEEGTAGARTTSPGVADLPELVRRYAGSGTGPIELETDPGLGTGLSRQVDTTVYRVVVESLTNVRRHAAPGATVTVTLRRSAEGVWLTVTDRPPDTDRGHREPGDRPGARESGDRWDGVRDPAGRRHSGIGLAGLAERVEALGGTFSAGPLPPGGWQVRACLPAGVAGSPGGAVEGSPADATEPAP
ncbi:sensor histidine kinase [Streptosporangium sp. NPDC050855]|uniref:sensor histidine kinase n=1 Tax=Streptosporangium sp. NPDC050855 TaxID=3366194 RepID=UPI0037ABC694